MIRIYGCGIAGLVAGLELHKAGIEHQVIGVRDFYRKAYECQAIVSAKGKPDIFARAGITPSTYGIKPHIRARRLLFRLNDSHRELRFHADIYIRGMHPESLDSKLWTMYRKTRRQVEEKSFSPKDMDGETVIVADGFRSTISNWLGVNKPDRIGGAILCTARGNIDTETVYVSFKKEISGYGYSYVLPISPEEATVATCLPEPTALPERLEKFKKEVKKVMDIKSFSKPHFGWGKWVNKRTAYLEKDGRKFYIVGDAGSTMEPFAGFGISNAIASAVHAATAIKTGNPSVYEKAFKKIEKSNNHNLRVRKMMERFGINALTERLILKFIGQS